MVTCFTLYSVNFLFFENRKYTRSYSRADSELFEDVLSVFWDREGFISGFRYWNVSLLEEEKREQVSLERFTHFP